HSSLPIFIFIKPSPNQLPLPQIINLIPASAPALNPNQQSFIPK
ncbi:hypothetical protein KSS87_004110, partial [Heliosperma pusillum]